MTRRQRATRYRTKTLSALEHTGPTRADSLCSLVGPLSRRGDYVTADKPVNAVGPTNCGKLHALSTAQERAEAERIEELAALAKFPRLAGTTDPVPEMPY